MSSHSSRARTRPPACIYPRQPHNGRPDISTLPHVPSLLLTHCLSYKFLLVCLLPGPDLTVPSPSLCAFITPCPAQNELRSLVQYGVWHEPKRDITAAREHATSGWDRQSMRDCWAFLDLTSRSFAAVIKELDGELARVVRIPSHIHSRRGRLGIV